MKRSTTYARIADQLATACNATIGADGRQIGSDADGQLWDGTVFYCIGEMARVRGCDPALICGRDYTVIARGCLERWSDESTLKRCFAAMGLGMLGRSGPDHPVLGGMSEEQRKKIETEFQVTHAYAHNWEIFNACLRVGRTALYGDEPALVLPHIEKMVGKYEVSGYFDDSDNRGDYNSYGLMTINYGLRASEFLAEEDPVRQRIETAFLPHALRYTELLKLFIGSDGMGWLFGRSAGVLGQLQCLSFLEQIISKRWLEEPDAAWARCACQKLTQYMTDVFWDEEKQWFNFRDEWRTCFGYRWTLPMAWDLWRYFLQLEHYATIDEKEPGQTLSELPSEPLCREIVTDPERHTSYLVWSDGTLKWQMPIMGGPTVIAGDNLPRPYLPGLFEWCTDKNPPPVLCPRFTIGATHAWPAWWPDSTQLTREGDAWRYRVTYPALVDNLGRTLDLPIRVEVHYRFGSGFFERTDRVELLAPVRFDEVRMEVLQGAPHPQAKKYPRVYLIDCTFETDLPDLESATEDVSGDPAYRNYFSHAVTRFALAGTDISLEEGHYSLRTLIRW